MKKYNTAEIERIASLLRNGLSASQIAVEVGAVSRNAIIGLVRRNTELRAIGFSKKSGSLDEAMNVHRTRHAAKPPKPKLETKSKLVMKRRPGAPVFALVAEKNVAMPTFDPLFENQPGVDLMNHQAGMCNGIVSDREGREPHLYCALPATNGNYCAGHHAKYTLPNPYRAKAS
jgi:hypothetical protein